MSQLAFKFFDSISVNTVKTGNLKAIGSDIQVRDLLVFPGATSGPPISVQLIGDQRELIFGTTNGVSVGNRVYTEGLCIAFTPSEHVAFYGGAGVGQASAIPDATDGPSAAIAINSLLAWLRLRGDVAT